MRKKSKPIAISGVLRELTGGLRFGDMLEQARVYRIWRESVGDAVARNTCPATIRGSVLHVNVSSSVWVQQLRFLGDMLLEKINAGLTGFKLTDIRFRVGPVNAQQESGAPRPLPELAIPEQEKAERESAAIGDPELREAFRHLMETHLKNTKSER
jgi:hypothetical protein